MKKALALTLAVVLILSALLLTVFARTAEGVYDGYYYTATLTATAARANTSMTYMGTAKIQSTGTAIYEDTYGVGGSTLLSSLLKQSSTSGSCSPPVGSSFTSVNQSYYVFNTKVDYISFNI